MKGSFGKTGALYPFAVTSLIMHLFSVYLFAWIGPLNFCEPISSINALIVTLKGPDAAPSKPSRIAREDISAKQSGPALGIDSGEESGLDPGGKEESPPSEEPSYTGQKPDVVTPPPAAAQKDTDIQEGVAPFTLVKAVNEGQDQAFVPVSADYEPYRGRVRDAGEFLTTKREKLTYRISLLKIPAGTAVMEASNNGGELRIAVRITSNAVFSSIYPVDDLVETRMIKGVYLLTRVRQKEGSYRGDFGFTLMLRERKAFWVDRLASRYDYRPLPGDDVLDAVSGFYLLRNRDLEVGREEKLNLFDSNDCSPTTVKVLRRERIGLPGAREVNTLVIHPLFKSAGFFRRTGDITIWLSDDQNHVPVRIETAIPLGKVTAELVSAESEPL